MVSRYANWSDLDKFWIMNFEFLVSFFAFQIKTLKNNLLVLPCVYSNEAAKRD